jgi:hypothetical protein
VARCRPGLAWKRTGLPTEWVPVLERNEEAMELEPRPGYVWVAVHGRQLHIWADHREFRVDGS